MPDPSELTGDGLLLRPWRDADVEQLEQIVLDPDIARWSGAGRPTPAAWCARVADWSDGTHATWAVTRGDRPGRVVGHVSLHHLDADSGEVGYWTVPTQRGRGTATRAVGLATAYAFDVLELHRVQLFHAVANLASCRTAERAGYRLEGTHRESYRYGDGEWHDEHAHARLRSDRETEA